MRTMLIRCLTAVICLGFVLCSTAAMADAYGYKIDAAAMKERENADSFAVRVTQKKVVEEYFDTEIGDYASDLLAFRVENGTDAPITGFTLYFVAYDKGQITRDIVSKSSLTYSPGGGSPQLNTVNIADVSIAPKATFETGLAVVYSCFSGVRAMIAEYTREDGTVVSNPAFEEWRKLAYGMISDNSTELD